MNQKIGSVLILYNLDALSQFSPVLQNVVLFFNIDFELANCFQIFYSRLMSPNMVPCLELFVNLCSWMIPIGSSPFAVFRQMQEVLVVQTKPWNSLKNLQGHHAPNANTDQPNNRVDVELPPTGHIPLRHLVYRVHALPGSMRPLIWDFGQLKPDVERLYINQIVSRLVSVLYHLRTRERMLLP